MPESQLIEYKESWRDEYLKSICGFDESAQAARKNMAQMRKKRSLP